MRALLDTHVFLWMQAAPERLNDEALAFVRGRGNDLLLSAASSWEIAIKVALGKLRLPESPEAYVPDRMRRTRVRPLAVEHAHALRAGALPPHHRDPFDRLLVAQAQLEKLPLVSADPVFARYGIEVLPAG